MADKKARSTDVWGETHEVKYRCATCMHYLNFRCRRHAPTMSGYPAVYPTDWCGDHKMAKEEMNKQSA